MPTHDIVWTPQARADLLGIYVLIGLDSPIAAERYFARIEQRIDALAHHPRLGPRRLDIRPTLRVLVEAPYLLLYRTEPDSEDGPVQFVEIVRICGLIRQSTAQASRSPPAPRPAISQ